MRIALVLCALALGGCSMQIGPVGWALGNGGSCRGAFEEGIAEDGAYTVACDGTMTFGGPISEGGAALVRGAANAARTAAGAALGAPVP